MITCQGRNNQTTVPVLDHHGNPLAPARPSRIRRWLESGRGQKVWIKGIFAVQFTDVDAVHAITGDLALNMDPGETTGIAHHARFPRRRAAHHRGRLRVPAPQPRHSPQSRESAGETAEQTRPATPAARPVQQPRQQPLRRLAAAQREGIGRRHADNRARRCSGSTPSA